jgi:hypothetical protein
LERLAAKSYVEKRFVTPAEAGVQVIKGNKIQLICWIPASAGMTASNIFSDFLNKHLQRRGWRARAGRKAAPGLKIRLFQ